MDDDLLCLAFCVTTETNRPSEMAYVAGCILNRVRAQYRGTTVREVVLKDWQFSAFRTKASPSEERLALQAEDPDAAVAAFNAKRGRGKLFEEAVDVCGEVLSNEELNNPWLDGRVDHPEAGKVWHYFSPVSMDPPSKKPSWYDGDREVLVPEIPASRFRWFHSIP